MSNKASTTRVVLQRKDYGVVTRMIHQWRQGHVIDDDTASRMADSIAISPFDWRRATRYAFIISVACLVIAISAALDDVALMQLLARIFHSPPAVKSGFFAVAAMTIFRYGLFLRKHRPHRPYSNEAVFFLGVLALAVAIFFLGVATGADNGDYPLLFLVASTLYALLGLWFPSALVWVFGLLSLGTWMGTQTGYMSGEGAYFLGMNYPFRFVIFGAVLTTLGTAGQRPGLALLASPPSLMGRLFAMSPQTKVMGLLYLFIALWIMSIFGNYGSMTQWQNVRQYELLQWSVLFGAVAIAAVWYGLKRDDGVLRGFGLTFLFLNLYTRFFEYFWNVLDKAAFFAVLAISFWYLGRRAETIWHLGVRGL